MLKGRRAASAVLIALVVGFLAPPAEAQYFRYGKNKVQYEGQEWSFVRSEHFDVYYYEGGYYLADFTARAAEAAYAQLTDLFQYRITNRIPFIVYQSHNDFAVTNAVNLPTYSEGIGGVTELYKNRIAVPFMGDYRDFRRVIHHELVHAVLNDYFYGGSLQSVIQNNIQLQIPLWFNEGLAEYAALGWDTQSDMYVREAVLENRLAPIPYLGGYFAYRGGQSVWDYIVEQYGREKIAEILQRIRLTRSVEAGFRRATGLSLEDLSERWQDALKQVYYPELAAREDLETIARPIATREAGYYNTSPALSPQGDYLAFITTKGTFFDVYLAQAGDGKIIRKLVDGQDNPQFESLRILTPGLSWSPDGKRLAIAVKSKERDAIALVNIADGKSQHYRIPKVDQIITVAWSPDGNRIAFEASTDAQSDIYVLDLTSRQTTNYTNDIFSDHEPAWSADGKAIVFHSDRGLYTELGVHGEAGFNMAEHNYSQFDVYLLRPGEPSAERLTYDETWDDQHARFGPDGKSILFISDRNGIYNLYEKNLQSGIERPLTNVAVGMMEISLSADGRRAAFVTLDEGTPSIFLLRAPFERRQEQEILKPNVWAERVSEAGGLAPALALAPTGVRNANALLRDATDGRAYQRDREGNQTLAELGVANTDWLTGTPRSTSGTNGNHGTNGIARGDSLAVDTTRYGNVAIDFRNYVFTQAFDEARADEEYFEPDPFEVTDNRNADGSYKPRRYRLTFSPDVVYGSAGYETLYGVQGVTQMMFSDMLGDHQFFVATNLLIDLRNSDYIVAYQYLPNRTDWTLSGFHISRMLPDYNRWTYYRYRQYGVSLAAGYPLDKFKRVDAEFNIIGVSQADISDPSLLPVTRTIINPTVTFTRDVTTPGYMYPVSGNRSAVSISGSPGNVVGKQIRFITLLGDARQYYSFWNEQYSFAFRGSAGTSIGANRQLFYTAGVQNWINRRLDPDNGFPINDLSDFVFALPVVPLRGFDLNARNGSNFWSLNSEFRFPMVAAILPGPIPFIPLYNLQGSAFVDAGAVWGGRGIDKRLNIFHRDAAGRRTFDDLMVGAGFGLRTILLGYPLRIDWAWPYDGRQFGRRHIYFSIGLDF